MASNYLQSVHIPVVVSLLSVAVIIATTVLHFYNEWMRKQQLQALPVAELKNDDWKEALFRASAQVNTNPGPTELLKLQKI
jgi:hypothetical protein